MMRARRVAPVAVVAMIFASVAVGAGAQPKGAKGTQAAAPSARASTSASTGPAASGSSAPAIAVHGVGAVSVVAGELARAIGAGEQGALVVSSPLAADQKTTRGDDLAVRVAVQLAGRLGAQSRAQAEPLAVARANAGKSTSLVYLVVEIVKGELRATADVYPVVSNGWERIRNPLPGPRAHAFAAAPIDAEVRTFLPPVQLERATLHRARIDEGDVIAIACGDVDGDGGMELAIVTPRRVSLGRVISGRFVAEKTAAWSSIASRVPVPLREPFAGAVVSPPDHRGSVLVGTTDRGGALLDASLVSRAPLYGIPFSLGPKVACLSADPETGSFDGPASACDGAVRDLPVVATPPLAHYDAFAAIDLVRPDGAAGAELLAAREPGGKLRLKMGEATQVLEGVGAEIAAADLDQDGVPEIIASLDGPDDALRALSWDGSVVRQRLRFPAPAGVRAVATCPPEEGGAPAIAAVVGSEVWIVR